MRACEAPPASEPFVAPDRQVEGRTLTLHIGLPKTATTFLQTGVFPRMSGPIFLATPQSALFEDPDDAEADHRIMSCALKRSAAIWRECGDVLFAEMLGPRSQWTPQDVLISDEGIGRIASRPELLRAHLDAIAERAAGWGFSRLKLVCVFRRQDHWLASHYAQVSDRNSAPSQADFERTARNLVAPFHSRYRLGMLLDYATLYDVLTEAAGATQVAMMPYERFKTNPDGFQRELSTFLGAPEMDPSHGSGVTEVDRNARSSGADTWAIRPARRHVRPHGLARAFERLGDLGQRRRARTVTLTPEVSVQVLDAYRASNARLASALGLELSAYGY